MTARDSTHVPASLLACVSVLVVAIYWAGLGGGFFFDDFPNIVANTRLHVTTLEWNDWMGAAMSSPAADLPRPLAMLSFAVNHYFTGLDPLPMKLTNSLIHAFNSMLVVVLFTRVFELLPVRADPPPRWLPLLAGLAWALHPINLSAVLLVVQRMEVLSHTFVLLGLLSYVAGRRMQLAGGSGWWLITAGMLGCTVIGIASKESAALTPLYALLFEWTVLRFHALDDASSRRLKAFFLVVIAVPAVIGLIWIAPRSIAEGAYTGREFTLFERVLTEARVVTTYARWIALPDLGQLSLNHDDFKVSTGLLSPPSTAFAFGGIGLGVALAFWLRPRLPEAALGILWFGSAHLLTATIIPLELMFEHRNYFASSGLIIAIFSVIACLTRNRPWQLGLMLGTLLTLLYGAMTLARASEWGDPIRFSRSEALKRPLSPRATYDWGRTLVIAGAYDPNSAFTREAFPALEHARQVPGSTILPSHALIILANRTGSQVDPDWWIDIVDKLRRQSIGPEEKSALAALVDCANIGACRFPRRDVMAVFDAALARGDDSEILNIYASYAWRQWQDVEFSRALWLRSIELNPREAQYRINLGKLLVDLGRGSEAREQIEALRRHGKLGQNEAAAADLERRWAARTAPKATIPSPDRK